MVERGVGNLSERATQRAGGLEWLDSLGPQKIRPGLSRTRALLAALGNPERSFRSALVAGTNGKGSTAAAAAAVLRAAGVRAGLYTSPHLVAVTERIRVDEVDVSPPVLDDALRLVEAVAGPGDLSPTYFEALTVAAFEIFRRSRVRVAIVEVGIGGLLDATNVLEPEVSVVTNIGADHLETLGPAIADVARQKAGIFRPGRLALSGAAGEGRAVLREETLRIGARLVEVPPTSRFRDVSPLPGRHQEANLALAAALATAFAPVDDDTLRRGVAATRWPGRLQRISRNGCCDLILDGAHNPDGASALAAWLDEEGISGRVDLLFGALSDKDLAGIFRPLAARSRRIVLASPDSPRAAPAEELARRLGRSDLPAASSAAEGLACLADASDVPVLVAGSLYLVGDVLKLLRTESSG